MTHILPIHIHDHDAKPKTENATQSDETEKEKASHHREEEESSESHFSYFAFDGRTGALRWKHEAGDFYGEDTHLDEQVLFL